MNNNDILKANCKKAMISYLKSKGWPDKMDNKKVVDELPNLWRSLEKAGLMPELKSKGYDFQKFHQTALSKLQEVEMMNHLEGFFKFRF